MAKGKDPATLWYWNDWNGGTGTFTRHLKGCYMDLLSAQFNNGHLSLEEVKTVLGSDFGSSWPTLQKKFKQDPQGLFFNERADIEKFKRAAFTESRRNNLKGEGDHKEPQAKPHMRSHMENEDENRNAIGSGSKGVQGEETISDGTFDDWQRWGDIIVDGNDYVWEQMKGRLVGRPELDEFLSVATRNDWKMKSQQAFRTTLNGFTGKTQAPKNGSSVKKVNLV